MYSRKSKLLLIVSSVMIAGLVIASLTGYFVSLSSLRDEIAQNDLPLTSDNVYSEIQRDLMRTIFISSQMASNTFLRDWTINGEKNSDDVTRYLREIRDRYHTVSSFFVSDKTRRYYHADGPLRKVSEQDPRDAWYFRVKDKDANYEISVEPDIANQGAMTVFVDYRVFDYKGNFIGITGVGLTVASVDKLIATYQSQFGRSIYITDKDGRVVLSGIVFPDTSMNINQMEGLGPYAGEVLGQREKSLKFTRKGGNVYLNSRYLPEFGWYLIVEQDERAAKQRILSNLMINLLICGVIAFVVVRLTRMTIHSYQDRVERLASTDKLTGLYNRQAFDLMFEQAEAEAKRDGTPFALVSLDLDHFKLVNDTYGHLAGDAVLERAARTLQGGVRTTDAVFRWGGEEFLVLLKKCPANFAMAVAEKLRNAVRDSVVVHEGHEIPITVSAGVANYREGDKAKSLQTRADQALYKAKRLGRDRVVAAEE